MPKMHSWPRHFLAEACVPRKPSNGRNAKLKQMAVVAKLLIIVNVQHDQNEHVKLIKCHTETSLVRVLFIWLRENLWWHSVRNEEIRPTGMSRLTITQEAKVLQLHGCWLAAEVVSASVVVWSAALNRTVWESEQLIRALLWQSPAPL